MKRAWSLILVLAAGCSSISEPDPDIDKPKSEAPAPPPPNPKEVELRSVRSQLAAKKADLSQASADLDRLAAEREQLNAADASDAKTKRLAEMGALESEANRKKQALALDIGELEARLRDLTSGTKSADDPLAAALAEDAAVEKDRRETLKAKEEAERSEQGARIQAAEAARRAEAEAKAKEKVDGGRVAQAEDGTVFEERWADVILRVRESMQQYKRW
jgi:hypothetical protein